MFIAALADRLDPEARADVLDRGSLLPHDLAERLAGALGLTLDPELSISASAGPGSQLALALHPLASPAELTEVLLRVTHARTGPDPAQVEQVLEGLVRFAATVNRAEMRTALHPVVQDDWYQWQLHPEPDEHDTSSHSAHLGSSLLYLAAAALGDPVREGADVLHEHGHRGPAVAMLSRIHSLIADLRAGTVDRLVSFPSTVDGRIDAHELALRLSVARHDHGRLSATDIDAALLRVGPTDNTDLLEELSRLNRHPVDHLPSRFELDELVSSHIHWDGQPVEQRRLTVRPSSDNPAPDATAPGARLDPRTLDASTETCYSWYQVDQSCWPLIAPHHRELLASWFVAGAAEFAVTLPALIACRGDMEPALALVIAHALAAGEAATQANAVDALLLLSGRDELDDRALSDVLVTLLQRGDVKLARLPAPLRDAAFAGIPQHVWELIRPVLEHAISGQPIPPGTPDLMALATELVPIVHPAASITGLDELADRKGRTRQIVEARRLREALATI